MIIENNARVYIKMIPDEKYEEKQKDLEAKLLEKHLSKMSRDEQRECLDLELDLEREQGETPDVSCLPTLYKTDIPTEKEHLFPNQTHDSRVF